MQQYSYEALVGCIKPNDEVILHNEDASGPTEFGTTTFKNLEDEKPDIQWHQGEGRGENTFTCWLNKHALMRVMAK